jgi:hypothetical protein
MRHFIFRLSVAILSFVIGITASIIWVSLHELNPHRAENTFSSNDLPKLKTVSSGQSIESRSEQSQGQSLTRTRRPFFDRHKEIAPVQISPSRLLVTVGDTICMLDSERQILWKWDAGNGEDIMAQPFVDSHGNIIGIADDGLIFSLDSNGKVRWAHSIMGAYRYTQLKPYSKDQFLVVVDASSYREVQHFNEDDFVYLYQDQELIGEAGFYRSAELQVRGKRIYAVMRNKGRVRRREIKLTKVNAAP